MEALDTQLKASLDKRRGDWKQIADASGISYSWLSQFVRDKIPNPGYATLQKLAATLQKLPPLPGDADGAPPVPETVEAKAL
jgi:transcriptional regulator with XRE-family HTH domain